MRTLFISFIIAVLILFLIQRNQESFIDFKEKNIIGVVLAKGSMSIKKDKMDKCLALLPDTEVVIPPKRIGKLEVKYYEDVDCQTEALTNQGRSFFKIMRVPITSETGAQPTTDAQPTTVAQPTTDAQPTTMTDAQLTTTVAQPTTTAPVNMSETPIQMISDDESDEESDDIEGFNNVILARHF